MTMEEKKAVVPVTLQNFDPHSFGEVITASATVAETGNAYRVETNINDKTLTLFYVEQIDNCTKSLSLNPISENEKDFNAIKAAFEEKITTYQSEQLTKQHNSAKLGKKSSRQLIVGLFTKK